MLVMGVVWLLVPEDERVQQLAEGIIARLNACGLTTKPVTLRVAPDEYDAIQGDDEYPYVWAAYRWPIGDIDPEIAVLSPVAWARILEEDGVPEFAYSIAHEYMHHVQWSRGDTDSNEEEADDFAQAFVRRHEL